MFYLPLLYFNGKLSKPHILKLDEDLLYVIDSDDCICESVRVEDYKKLCGGNNGIYYMPFDNREKLGVSYVIGTGVVLVEYNNKYYKFEFPSYYGVKINAESMCYVYNNNLVIDIKVSFCIVVLL